MSRDQKSLGKVTHRTVSVSSTATLVSIGTNKEGMTIQNNGSAIIYLGGSGVTSSSFGIQLVPRQMFDFGKIKDNFEFYVVTASGSSTLGVMEYF